MNLEFFENFIKHNENKETINNKITESFPFSLRETNRRAPKRPSPASVG